MKTICITIDFEKQSSCSITMTQLEEIGDVSWVGGLKFDYGGDIGQEVWMVECFIDNNEIGFNLDREYNFKDEYEYFLQYFRRKKIATKEELRLAPLWCSSFVRVLSNRILKFAEVRGGVKHCSINSIVEERNIGTAGYLGVKFGCIFGTKVFKGAAYESDAYALDRLHFGPYAAEIDPLNISIGKDLKHFNSDLVKNHNKFSIKRIAITLLDAGSQFVFANANTTGFITNCAEQMEKSLTAQRAESFTSFLVKERISSPISLNYSPQEESSFFIRYLDESIGVHNALDESLQISSNNNTLPSLASASKGLRLGLAENFRFIKKAIEEGEDETANARLYFYPINHGASLYFFPAFILFLIVGSQMADSDRKIESNFLPIVRAEFSEALTIEAITLLRRAKQFACKSAIGSIMSRNGSHNIGSHVLAALSHNVGTMPDDRVLYQYIQHRMDYIATATTEFPVWRQPTMLVSNIIREFLRQKHLLDYISGSEGLHAYNFQGHFASIEQENSIRVHVRRVEQKEGWETNGCLDCGVIADFIVYLGMQGEENIAKKVDFEKDLAIAIPGGTVGNHAFFTIIENVLRNAAKHEWAVAVKYWKKLQEEKESIERLLSNISESKWSEGAECWKLLGDSKGPEDIEGLLRNKSDVEKVVKDLEERLKTTSEKLPICKPTNLDLYVDFADNPEQGIVECRVWTNIAVKSREYQSADLTALKKVLEEKIGAGFIDDETGRLRKENWGIAEMRISAGYLQGRDIADIGGLTSREKALEIIRPVIVSAGGDVACLGYRFDVYKPRELLVVIKDSRSFEEADILSDANTKAMQYGIVFKRESEVLSAKSNPYSYVLFEELNLNEPAEVKKYKDAKLPYRVLGWRVQQVCEDKDDDKDKVGIPKRLQEVACYNGNFFNKDSGDVLEENLGKICDWNNDGSEICYSLLEEVYGFWLDKIRKIKNDGSNRKLVLDLGLKDDKSGARKSLVSDYDLLKFVFAHTFGAAVRSFLATKNEPEVTEECAALLLAIISMPNRQLASVKDLAAKYSGKSVSEVSPGDEYELLSNEFAIVYNQIGIWAEELLKGGHEVVLAAEGVPPNWWVSFENKGWIVTIDEWDVFSKDEDNDSAINKLIEYILAVILKQAEAFLRKYEEEIATLPKGFSIESNGTSFSWEWDVGSQEIEFTCDQGERNAHVNEDFCYFRHGEKAFPTLIDAYYEALSGAQSSFNALVPFKNAVSIVDMAEQRANGEEIHDRLYLQNKNFVVRFMTGLVENSTFKILIIDERVKKFMDDHSNVRNNIGGLGIVVRDHNDNAVRDMFSDDQRKNLLDINFSDDVSMDAKTKVCLKTFDIIVIHQGIIDKLLKNHESKESVGTWLAKMESLRSYVVITTGRGTPANIPDEARVLPYSVIESSILQRFPEKMILVDTIMNLLPSVKEN